MPSDDEEEAQILDEEPEDYWFAFNLAWWHRILDRHGKVE